MDDLIAQLGYLAIFVGTFLEGERARDLGNEFKGVLQSLMTSYEPELRTQANRAITQALREGKGTISTGELLKSLKSSGSK